MLEFNSKEEPLTIHPEDLEEKPESRFKKVFIILLALFLIIIFLIYVIATAGNNFLAGLIESSKVKENQIDFSLNGKIIFENNSLKELQELWIINPEKEFKVCLQGEIRENHYYINNLYIPTIFSQSSNQVRAEPCSEESLIDLHSHPFRHCIPSEQDIETFKQFRERQPAALMVIMCEEKRFTVYEGV